MRNYTYEITRLETQLKSIKSDLKEASKFTQTFLDECGKSGIKVVSIGKKSELVPATVNFPFGCSGSVFQNSEVRDKYGWPAIWGVVGRLNIGGGCGNTDQYSVKDCPLIEGVYELKGKTWRKVE